MEGASVLRRVGPGGTLAGLVLYPLNRQTEALCRREFEKF
jgi:hypothetical protein